MTGEAICRELDRSAAEGASLQALLTRAVKLLHQSNPRFHWTGIYELTPENVLRLGPYQGAATEHTTIPVGRGICGTAVQENRNLNIPDVSQVGNYLACSADTRAELVVLIRDGDKVFGQIDIDSHEAGAFAKEDVTQVEKVAACLARAYTHASRDGS